MHRNLLLKFILGYILVAVLSFTLVATLSYRLLYRGNLEDEVQELRTLCRHTAGALSNAYLGREFDEDRYLEYFSLVQELNDVRCWFLDSDCVVLYDSLGTLSGEELSEFDPTVTDTYLTDAYPQLGDGYISVFSSIAADFQIRGYVVLSCPLTYIVNLSNSQLRPVYLTCAIIYALSFIILVIAYICVISPIRAITAGADQYARGNFKYRINTHQRDEIGYLARTLEVMADDLDKSEDSQRKFISNISHDFRSPLTSIKGYLEAIRDGIIPPENQEHYLNVVISETERLSGLTQNLLRLASLTKGELLLDLTDFDINGVIKDSCASFEGQCDKKHMDFDLYFSDETAMVHGDRARIQQVLYNLIDNAIKFSPEGSTITIDVSERSGKYYISVRDKGIGISRENISRIWTRFYKTDESRGKDKKGTGLGLSIVKEIITAHGENIDVISTVGAGTEFVFSLKKAD